MIAKDFFFHKGDLVSKPQNTDDSKESERENRQERARRDKGEEREEKREKEAFRKDHVMATGRI